MSSFLLPHLSTKKDVDRAIKGSEDKVVVLRFGRVSDGVCMQLDDTVSAIQMASKCSYDSTLNGRFLDICIFSLVTLVEKTILSWFILGALKVFKLFPLHLENRLLIFVS